MDDPLPENLIREDGALFIRKKPVVLEAQDRFFRSQRFKAKSIFELGVWRGGSTAFWFEYFHPDKLVAVDIADREHEPEFLAYLRQGDRSRGANQDLLAHQPVRRRAVVGDLCG